MNKQFNILKTTIFSLFIALSLITNFAQVADAQGTASTTAPTGSVNTGIGNVIEQVGKPSNLPNFDAGHSKQSYQAGASQITSTIYYILDFFKYILGGIATLMIIVSGMKLILSARQVQDVMSKEKETLRFAFSGLIIIIVADQVVRLFFGTEGEVYRTGTDMQLAADQASTFAAGVTGLIRIFIPSIAVLFLVIAAFRLLISRGDTEQLGKAKTQITWAILGIIVAGLAEIIVFRVLFPAQGSRIPDAAEFSNLVVTMTNFISGFISTIAVIMIIYAGYLYVTSLGGDGIEKAKKILIGAVVGLLIAMAAFGLVNTFIKVEPLKSGAVVPTDQTIPGT